MEESRKSKKSDVIQDDKISVTELAKKVFYTGLGALFVTEETVRNALSDVKLPKEAIAQNFQKTKEEFLAILSKEIRHIFENNTISIKADIEFKPKK